MKVQEIQNNLAHIHPNAKIGHNVHIGPFTFIDSDVEIGDNCWIGPNVTIFKGARIGENCKIYPGAVISGTPQDLKYQGEETLTFIGSNTTIREFVTVNKGTSYANKTVVGDNCLLMAYVHVAHDCILGNNVILANNVNLAGHVEIDDFAILEGLVAVQQFLKIGAHSFIAGNTMVRKSVPPFTKAAREPISYAGVNSVGLLRRGYSEEQVRQIQDIYRILYVKTNNTTQALLEIETDLDATKERDEILDFIRNADRGIMRGLRTSKTK